MTVAELLVWAEARAWGVAVAWARLTAGARQRGRPRPANDTWVAACCVAYKLPLATLNRVDFEDFERHDGLEMLPAS